MKQKLLMVFTMVLISMGNACAYDFAVENEDGKVIYYNKTYGGVEVTYKEHSQPSYFGDIVIPPSIIVDGIRYPVTCIGYDAFRDCVALTSIKLPNSIIAIDGFAGCSGLKSIEMPNTITSIGASAFMNCSSLESIKIPYWVQDILPETFKGCSGLKSIEMPYRITSIGDWAFYGCSSLESIELPNSIKYIGEFVFSGCSSLASIEIPSSVTSIGQSAFEGCSSLTSFEIPSSITSIGWCTFYGCSGLKSIEIPNSITSIGMSAFEECSSLTSVEIPDSVTFIGRRAFSGCISLERFIGKFSSMDQRYLIVNDTLISFAPAGLTTYTNPNPVTTIGGGAFWGCRELTAIEIPNTVKSIETSAFAKSGIKNISIPNSVDTIDSYAFRECRELTSVKMPNSLKHFSNDAFWDCPKLKEFIGELASEDHRCLIINDTLMAFAPADLTTYTIPNSATSVDYGAFYGCKNLKSVVFLNSVTSIETIAFAECSGLESIVIPNSVTSIGVHAFRDCSSLKSVDVAWQSLDNLKCDESIFEKIHKNCTLYVPSGTNNLYKSTSPWSNFKYIVEKPSSCKSPVITIQNNQLVVTCETEGAEIHTTITSDDINTFNHKSGDVISLTGQYLVTSYATVGENGQSEPATAVLVWSKVADIETGVDAIDMNTDRALLIRSVGENIEIAGTSADEAISLYNMSGQQLYTGKSTAKATTIPVALTRGEIYIIKIGEQSIKYKF